MSDTPNTAEPTPEAEDDYVPLELPEPPRDEAARRAMREANEARETQREIIVDRLASAYADLHAAEQAGDTAAAGTARERITSLIAARDRL